MEFRGFYVFVRDQVARPALGRWMGLLLAVFLTVLVWNFASGLEDVH
ncbi:hypothetical protein [Nonomuraea longicatena]